MHSPFYHAYRPEPVVTSVSGDLGGALHVCTGAILLHILSTVSRLIRKMVLQTAETRNDYRILATCTRLCEAPPHYRYRVVETVDQHLFPDLP